MENLGTTKSILTGYPYIWLYLLLQSIRELLIYLGLLAYKYSGFEMEQYTPRSSFLSEEPKGLRIVRLCVKFSSGIWKSISCGNRWQILDSWRILDFLLYYQPPPDMALTESIETWAKCGHWCNKNVIKIYKLKIY